MSKRDQIEAGQKDMHLRIYDTGQIQFDWYSNAVATATGVFETGDWRHLAFTYDLAADGSTGVQRIYYDGELVATRANVTPYLGSGGALYIGSWGSNQYFRGLIDEFRVYNYALDAATIAAHYQLQYELFPIPEPASWLLLCLAGMAAVCRRGPRSSRAAA